MTYRNRPHRSGGHPPGGLETRLGLAIASLGIACVPLVLLGLHRPAFAFDEPGARPQGAPYLGPWVVVSAGDARVRSLPSLPPAQPSPNSPGVLLEVPAGSEASIAPVVSALIRDAHRGGRRAGVAVELAEKAVPTDPRAAEAANADTLYPGLGALIRAATDVDLFQLGLSDLGTDPRARAFALKKVASEIRAACPSARIGVTFRQPADLSTFFPPGTGAFLSEGLAAFVDDVGLTLGVEADPRRLREAVDALAFGRPLTVVAPPVPSVDALLRLAARHAPHGVPVVAARVEAPPEEDAALDRLARLLAGDFGSDSRPATATLEGGKSVAVARLVSGLDLGGLVLVTAVDEEGRTARGPVTLALDSSDYAAAEIHELQTGRSKSLTIPRSASPTRLTLSTKSGSLAVVLTAREKAPEEVAKARVGVEARRGLTAEEILARHQAWRARRDARWKRLYATNRTSIRFRFADANTTLDETLVGAFFYEPGKGYDWAWQEAYFNGVRWRGKKVPELPLVQPEKVSDLPLALTFDEAYAYELEGEDEVAGIPCYELTFRPRATESEKALYDGTVWISKKDFSVRRTKSRQLNLKGEVQSVDEVSEFGPVPAPDGGEPLLFPTRITGQWILRTFSRTTVLERETLLVDPVLDPPDYDERKRAAFASESVMVRDTETGVRYLEKTKDGERVVTESSKSSRLFGLGGVFYDSSLDYPLPLLGAYYIDLDFRKRRQQAQVFFGGVLLAASFNEPKLFGTKLDLGADVFGIAVLGSDTPYQNGEEVEAQRVRQRSFAANLNVGYPLGRHVKASATLGTTYRNYREADETAEGFAIPTDHWVTRLSGQLVWDVSGWALSGRYGWNKRSRWEPWGFPANPDYDPEKDTFQTWSLTLAKDFHFTGFKRLRTSVSYLGSSNTDRFSKYQFGFFGGTSLRGFRSGSLRAEQTFVGRFGYGLAVSDALRIEGIYEHALVKDPPAGYNGFTSFGGAGLSGQVPGPWSTMVQLDVGLPVVGRNHGQKGFVVNLVLMKIF